MTPEVGLTEKMAEELRQKMEVYARSLTSDERQQIVDDLAALREWQETPNSPEDLAKIPMLTRGDLTREMERRHLRPRSSRILWAHRESTT